MNMRTERLRIVKFTPEMAEVIHRQSLDADTRRFVPDEVFETVGAARETIAHLISCYGTQEGPFVYPVLLSNGEVIGYVQFCRIAEGWEIGYHIGQDYRRQGYATEAVSAFLPHMMDALSVNTVYGICNAENVASRTVMTQCSFTQIYEGICCYQGRECTVCKFVYKR